MGKNIPKFIILPEILENNQVEFIKYDIYFNSKKNILYKKNNIEQKTNLSIVNFYNYFQSIFIYSSNLLLFFTDLFEEKLLLKLKAHSNNLPINFLNDINFSESKIRWLVSKQFVFKNSILNFLMNLKVLYKFFIINTNIDKEYDNLLTLKQSLIIYLFSILENIIAMINIINMGEKFYNISIKEEKNIYKLNSKNSEIINNLGKKIINYLEENNKNRFIENYETLTKLRNIIAHPCIVYENENKEVVYSYWQIDFLLNKNKNKYLINDIFLAKVAERNKSKEDIELEYSKTKNFFLNEETIDIMKLSKEMFEDLNNILSNFFS